MADQLQAKVPEAVEGIREPRWPDNEIGWKLVEDPISLPPFAELFCSSSLVSLVNSYLNFYCGQVATDLRMIHVRQMLMREKTRWSVAIYALHESLADIRIRRLRRW